MVIRIGIKEGDLELKLMLPRVTMRLDKFLDQSFQGGSKKGK